ncbi:hypothetical protein GCM10009839_60160 [Catenulispora yoronensis]|uniref:Uncharacterized protein n=1 Tax=Catenulispora yoronensis TaxID=450799 RepID=A0ABP5GIB3_9ACTN
MPRLGDAQQKVKRAQRRAVKEWRAVTMDKQRRRRSRRGLRLKTAATDGARGPSQIDVTASHKELTRVHSIESGSGMRCRQCPEELSRISENAPPAIREG